jgi:hypothetical protein
MNKVLTAAVFSMVALIGLVGAARADCYWAGNHWDCGDRFIYPKSYPWGTAVINGQYQRPPSPPTSDIDLSPIPAGSHP